jgi:hypothetical protein
VELLTAAPFDALSVSVTAPESWPGKLTVLGWKLMVTPLGSDVAESEYAPETVPMDENFMVAVTLTSGATMRGCCTFIVSFPEEPVGVEAFEEVVEVVSGVVVVEDEEATIGIET